ncbi:hypothetical protein B0A48_03498 [Cryoendolithus antarcticus]|uniref:Amino acid permease/ SLC12A domain-containing protein n=1 Tax=Cryoendolithus antarcticus TaxID=1507870 RepID=A0A1V8TKJ1_9PEZI|nr:hypothetical protein B0A48_03498 [Cryoendolithus antarcticus]
MAHRDDYDDKRAAAATYSPNDPALYEGGAKSAVEGKYQGNESDIRQMKVLGRTQETRRVFSFLSILGFGSTLIVTWEVILSNLGLILTNGGSAGMWWGFLIVSVGYILVYASISEMASMAPTSGGQYHWVSEFAPASIQRYLSYMTGWLCFTGWQSAITAIGFLVAGIIQGLIVLNNENYVPERWHATLLIIAVVAFCVVVNIFVARRLPLVEGVLAICHFAGIFIVIIVLWTLAPRNNAHDAFLKFSNNGGWSSDGLSFMVGLLPLTLCLLGFDSQVHMSEETTDAARSMPRSIMWSTYLNIGMGFLMIITLIFTMGDQDEILASPTGWPFIQVFYNTTRSVAGTDIMCLLLIFPLTGSVIACVATASRQIWAFARDGGVPFSATVRHVYAKSAIPINAIVISLIVCVLLSLINIGSTAALNAILALDLAALLASYTISISCILYRRFSKTEALPPAAWSLGKFGAVINILAICWLLPVFIFTLFPVATPVTAAGMNYGCLLFGFMVLFSTGYYIVHGKKHYISPKERLRRDLQGDYSM